MAAIQPFLKFYFYEKFQIYEMLNMDAREMLETGSVSGDADGKICRYATETDSAFNICFHDLCWILQSYYLSWNRCNLN